MPVNIKDIIKENDFLNSQNANYRQYVQELADFCLPRKAWQTTMRTKGEQLKFNFLYDSTAIRSLRIMAAGFHSNLTNPTSRWFALETLDKELMKNMDVRMWFKQVEDNLFAILNGSNFYNVIQEFYIDFGGFGTGTFLMMDDAKDVVRFTEIPRGTINLVEDANGRIIGEFRNFKLTADQAVRMFGFNNVGESIQKVVEKNPHEEFEFLHYVNKRDARDVSKGDNLNMPYVSAWIAIKDKKLIKESGFFENPYITGRFYKDSNDTNGFSPAMDVFADIKLANAMKKTIIRAAMKQADPPIVGPSKGFVLPLNFNPAGMNYRDAKTPNDALQPLPVTSGNLPITVDLLKLVQEDIEKGFFVQLFRSLAEITKQMTIPEVQRRVAENMVLLGPVVGRTIHEVLDPMIIRLFNMQVRNGKLPTPPEIIQDQDFQPVYLSPLAKAQRQSEIADIQSFLTEIGAIASVKPSALDKINEDGTIDALARIRGISPELLNEDEEIQRIRQHRAEQEEIVARLQAGEQISNIAKNAAQAEPQKANQ